MVQTLEVFKWNLYVTGVTSHMPTKIVSGKVLVLVPTVYIYVELTYIKYFSADKCYNFKGI